jgi:hypothetical protein
MLLLSLSLAASGWYNPDKVASNSETFKRYADAVQPKAGDMESGLAKASLQVQELDLGVNLLGKRAPAELVAYRDAVRKQYAHQGLEAQSFNDWFQDTSSSVFMQALDFAIEDLDGEVKECAPAAGGIAGIAGPGAMAGPKCEGDDLSAQLATALDASTDLTAVVDQLLGEAWPTVALDGQEWEPVALSGTAGYIRIAPLAEALLTEQLDALDAQLERDLRPLDLSDEGDKAKAVALRQAYEGDIATQGDRLFDAIAKATKDQDLGLCANPPALGGCSGKDRSKELLPTLAQDKKVLKALK